MQHTGLRNSAEPPATPLTFGSVVTSQVATMRLVAGLVQGIVLFILYRAAKEAMWPATNPTLFAPMLLVFSVVPVLLISSLGYVKSRQVLLWMLAASALIASLALYDVWRSVGAPETDFSSHSKGIHYPSWRLIVFTVVGFYIAHALVLAGAAEQRWIARYPTYFESGWKLLIQWQFSSHFVCALWLVLWLGASLFALLKLNFLTELLQQAWFAIPVTSFAYACAIHITDVRPTIVRGIRSLVLVLLSWILPIVTLIVAGFLLSLPGTGLEPLWATRHAGAVLLGTAAVLVVLINAAFQNGEVAPNVTRIVRMSARVAALALLPTVVIAIYALGLRVAEYGWTSDRIGAAACLLVASCYALGYAWAACQRSNWLSSIASVNIFAAFLALAVLLALFTPLADPARLSVKDQLARLAEGKVSAEKFDFHYLRFEGARYGNAALERLKNQSQGADAAIVRQKAEQALTAENRRARVPPPQQPADVAANIRVWPANAQLPPSFLQTRWSTYPRLWELPSCLKEVDRHCDAYLVDFNGDGAAEVMLLGVLPDRSAAVLGERDGKWALIAKPHSSLASCAPWREQLKAGRYALVAPALQELDINGQRIPLQPAETPALKCTTP